ncbi:MAG: family 10 glycosylhydrolase [Kastovskya adunca ATA6-11-RM4]|jgi:uncharacterized lipoprotein YddW (UPF0748 family)|nr:family 10 glycosylhydrolase [Kastovskya adunca ATA6-11-RM4]
MNRFVKNLFTACADGLCAFSRACGRQAWLVFLFILGITLAVVKPPAAYSQSTFSDVQGTWAQPCIEQLAQQQIISGYPDGSFKPSASVTRAEFAAMLARAFPTASEVNSGSQFIDVPNSYWAHNVISKAARTGFLSGYPGQIFRPTQRIPRVQVLVSLANGLKYVPTEAAATTLNAAFTDTKAIPEYATEAIAAATERQLVVNYPNVRSLNPNQSATRADVAAFLCQSTGIANAISKQYIAAVPTSAPNYNAQKREIRGVWLTNIDSDVLFSRSKLTSAIERLKQLNFNTLYPTVWNWGYTLYPSQVAEKVTGRAVRLVTPLDANLDPDMGTKGRDMLKEMIELGHQKGMRVIPWFEFGFMAPADSELAKRHPDWLTQKQNGVKTEKEGVHSRVWLNPFKPEVQQFIQDLVVEIVSNYNIDGIQFDDHFGLPSDFGYDPYTVALYKQEHGGKSPPANPRDPAWVRWRANKMTDFMTRVFRAVKDKKQNVIVALSPNPQRFSYEYFLADWETWERRGLVEELMVQIYRDDFNVFISELEQPDIKAARSHIPVGIGILSGLKNKPIPLSQINRQVEAVRQRGFAGVSFFFYETLWNNASEPSNQRQSAFGLLFPMPAEPPTLLEDSEGST